MSTGRFATVLQEQFAKDANLKDKCISSAKAKLRENITNRVFDDFPCVASDKDLQEQLQQFEYLLDPALQFSKEDLGGKDPKEQTQASTAQWVIMLNNLAHKNLFTIKDTQVPKEAKKETPGGISKLFTTPAVLMKIHSTCRIQEDLLKLLDWEDLEGMLNKKQDQLTQAYVHALLQVIIVKSMESGLIEKHQKNYDEVVGHINHSFHKDIELPFYAQLTAKQVVVGMSLAASVGVLLWGGYKLVTNLTGALVSESKKEDPGKSKTSPNPAGGGR